MGVAYYAVFERSVPNFDPSLVMQGKSIGRSIEQLDEICQRLCLSQVSGFHSESNAEAFEKTGEPVPPDLRDNPIRWSDPAEGIRTALALIDFFKASPDESSDSKGIVEDLQAFHQILLKAQENQTRFRLRIDI